MPKNELTLKRFEAKDFLGIDMSNPIVIEFDNARKGQNITRLSGDQGVGKTSTLTALMYVMGAAFNVDLKTFKNVKDEKIDVNLEFEHNGEKYVVTASGANGRIVLKKYFGEADKFVSIGEPKQMLKTIFGNLGVSPMFLKELAGKKQIQWFKDTFGDNPRINKQEEEIVSKLKVKEDSRREVNRDLKLITGALETNPLYQNYENNLKKFEKPVVAENEKKKFEAITEKKKSFDKYSGALDDLKEEKEINDKHIVSLKQQLADAEKESKELEKRIEDGKKWVEDNKAVVKEYEVAEKEWLDMAKKVAEYANWKTVLDQEKKLMECQDKSQTYDGEIDELRKDLMELTQKYLPKIKGLEVRVKVGLDDEDEGIYFENKTLAQLSESELWGLFLQIWDAKGVRFVFCENISSLGSDAVAILNGLAKEGAHVFATEMERKKKEIQVTFETKIQ